MLTAFKSVPAFKIGNVEEEKSMTHPVVAMEDESALFIKADVVWKIGNIHWIDKGEIRDAYSSDALEIFMMR